MLAAALSFCIVVTSCPGMPTALSVSAAEQQDDNMTGPGEVGPGDDAAELGEGEPGDDAAGLGEGEPEDDVTGPGEVGPGDHAAGLGEGEPGDDETEPQEGEAENRNETPEDGEADENAELPDNGENTQAALSADAAAEPIMTGWHFGEDAVYPKGGLFYEEGAYRLVLAGGSSEVQIPFEEIVSLLPTSVTVELEYLVSDHADSNGELSGEGASGVDLQAGNAVSESGVSVLREELVLPVTGWSCPEYVRDEDGLLPYRGSFFFQAQLGDEAAGSLGEGTARIGLEVVFDEPMTLAEVTDAAPGTITSDQTWGAQTLQAGTYTINPGVTVTLTGRLTVSGNVTINGGGTIVRDAGYVVGTDGSYGDKGTLFYVTNAGTLTLENITVDGKLVKAQGPVLYVENGSTVNLGNGAIIQNNKNITTGGTGAYAGGAVYCGGTLNINGGIIRNCSTSGVIASDLYANAGGAIYLRGICNMTSGSITNNFASNGGGIYLVSNSAKLNLSGGTISGNSAKGYGDGIYYSTLNSSTSTLSIGGDMNVQDIIYLDNSRGSLCPFITSKLQYTIHLACNSKAAGRVLAKGEGYTLTDADAAKVSMEDTNLDSKLDSTKNAIVLQVGHTHSVTGSSGTQEVFTELDKNAGRLESGSYYLAGDVSLDHALTVAKGAVVNLCLNGHKLEYAGSDAVSVIAVELDGVLNICDCDGAHGSHTFTSPATNQSVTISGGLITRSTPVDMVGSGIRVYGGGICNFYGGSVAGIRDTGNASSISGSHGAVRVEGVFHMYGGAITHNRSGCGGGVNVCSMYGRDACFYLHAGSISYNYADYDDGGGICLNEQCSFVMEGGEIRGNRAKSGGGGIECYGNGKSSTDSVRLVGGTITDNTTGGTVGGGIKCGDSNTGRPLIVSGSIRITGNTNASGKQSNLYLCSQKTLNIEGGLSSGADIGITTGTSPTSGNPVVITGTNAADFSRYFSSDLSDYMIADGMGHQVQLVNKPTDAEKVADAKRIVDQVLAGLTVDNNTTKESIQQEIDEALNAAGIGSDVTVSVKDFTKTEATSGAAGSVGGTVSITSGSTSENVTINKPIAKLPKSDAEKVADAINVVNLALARYTGSNDTTKEDFQELLDTAFAEAGITDVTVTVLYIGKNEATTSKEGLFYGQVDLQCGNVKKSLSISRPIPMLPKTDAEKVADAKKVVEDVLSGLTATNGTTKQDIQNEINKALQEAGIGSDVTVNVNNFTKTEATSGAAGSVGGTVSITSGNASENVAIDKPIAKLPVSDTEKVAAAKSIVEQALAGITADNDTTKQELQSIIDTALNGAGITDVTVTVGDISKTEATSSTAGSITGTVSITSGNASENVTINKPIAKLAGTGEEGGNSGSTGGNGNSGSTGGAGGNGNSGSTGGSSASGNSGSNDGSSGTPGISGSGTGNSGSIISEVITQGSSTSETGFATPTEELADRTLTPEEKQQAQDGTDIRIILHVEDASEYVSAEEKAVVEANLSGYAIGQYLDISLYKMIGESRTQITSTTGKIRIMLEIPESLRLSESDGAGAEAAEGSIYTRRFAILRIHDGQAEILPDLDDNADTITIETDRFSTYVLVFLDKEADDEEAGMDTVDVQAESGSSGGSAAGTAPGQGKDDEPKTGDVPAVELYATLSMIAGFTYLLAYFADRRHGMSEETKKELVSKLIAWAKKGKTMRRLLALAAIFMLLVYYHSIGKKTAVEWKEVYGK